MASALSLARHPYVRPLGGLVLFSTIALTLGDYLFKSTVAQTIPREDLGSFFALFFGLLNILALLVQVVLVGVPLWAEGEASPYVLLIVDGKIACASKRYGHSFVISRGHAVGVMEAMAEQPHWFDATTVTPVVALHGANEGLIDVFEDNFEMGMDYAALLARGVLSFIERAGATQSAQAPPP